MDYFNLTLVDVYRAFLVMFRTGALIMTVPVFGHVSIPRTLRLSFIILITVLVVPYSTISESELPATSFQLAVVVFSELAVGFIMGFVVVLIFAAVQFAGHVIGLQMGLAVANVIDPMNAGQISIIGQFYYLFSLLIFILINGHHMVIDGLVRSFHMVPLAGAVFAPSLQDYFIDMTFMVFVVGVKLAAPVIITLYIINAVLGIVARTVPQMNVFIVGFPLAIGAGLAVIGLSFPFFYVLLNNVISGLDREFAIIVRILSG
ncbi:MAG: flagellar biosynthetic protein FliR [Candidatus Latescibacteria bacterium]|nr:flagellar biosynthetic protein FliR [Candidatus Latescibacterota bacterium]